MNIPGRMVVHNVKVGRKPRRVVRGVRRMIRDTKADMVALLEAGAYAEALRDGLYGWRVQRGGDVVLLTRIRNKRPDVEPVSHELPWVGPKAGIRKAGREHMLVDGWLLIPHRITGGPSGPNKGAYGLESALIRATLHDLDVALCVGDQNATVSELLNWWRAQDMRAIRTGAKVDHGAARGLRVDGRRLLKSYGSDHAPVLYVITHKERSSRIVRASIGEWDEIGGLRGGDAGSDWNVVPVVAATEGTVSRFKLASFGRPITANHLDNLIPKETP